MIARWTGHARQVRRLVRALWIAYRNPRTPVWARIVTAAVVGYAFSPIDLVPDVITVLGQLDDLVLIPLGVSLAIRLIPADVWTGAHAAADRARVDFGRSGRIASAIIVALWLILAAAILLLVRRWLQRDSGRGEGHAQRY